MPSVAQPKHQLATLGLASFFALILALAVFTPSSSAQIPDVTVQISDTVGAAGTQNSVVTVFLDNPFDTIAGFELWLRIDNLNLAEFQTDTATIIDTFFYVLDTTVCIVDQNDDTICTFFDTLEVTEADPFEVTIIDTFDVVVGNIDTTGTLVAGWDLVASRSIFGVGNDVKVTALARGTPQSTTPLITPQQGGVLFRLLADIKPIPDTVTDNVAGIFIEPFLDEFNISSPSGASLGIAQFPTVDTSFFRCDSFVPPDSIICASYTEVSFPPFDSLFIDTIDVPELCDSATVANDSLGNCTGTEYILLRRGSITVLPGNCGDINGDGNVGLPDLSALIDHLFISFSPIDQVAANVDCSLDGNVGLPDLSVLIDHLFISFTPLCCEI